MTIAPTPPINSVRFRPEVRPSRGAGPDPAWVSADSGRPATAARPLPAEGIWSELGSLLRSVMSGTVTRMMNRIAKNLLARYSYPNPSRERPRTPARIPTNGSQPSSGVAVNICSGTFLLAGGGTKKSLEVRNPWGMSPAAFAVAAIATKQNTPSPPRPRPSHAARHSAVGSSPPRSARRASSPRSDPPYARCETPARAAC